MKKIDLVSLSASELVIAAKDVDIAKKIIKDEMLLNKLGYHETDNALFGSTYFWRMFVINSSDFDIKTARYLFEFLQLHKEIYLIALKSPEIINRLSDFQKESLQEIFNGKDDYQYYKYR
jgi:hypothetical protein